MVDAQRKEQESQLRDDWPGRWGAGDTGGHPVPSDPKAGQAWAGCSGPQERGARNSLLA